MATPVINAPPAALPQRSFDMPMVDQRGVVTSFWQKILYQFLKVSRVPVFLSLTHAQRLTTSAASYVTGSICYESDRTVYYVANGGAWVYESGVMQSAQASLPTDLGTNDTNLLLYVTDFAHLLQWNGASWQWGPREDGSDYIAKFVSGPSPKIG